MTAPPLTCYLAAENHLDDMLAELQENPELHGRLAIVPGPPRPIAWAANIWLDPRRLTISSIADGARCLRSIQRNWTLFPEKLHRRASLIAEQLPSVSAKPLIFPAAAPTAPLGSWTLLDESTIVAAARCASPFPNGVVRFGEDRSGPPNRAYLKLWEAFTVLGTWPVPGERCVDLGASPGGWSWVLARLGAEVVSVDKAPLAAAVARLPNVTERKASAFALSPADLGPV